MTTDRAAYYQTRHDDLLAENAKLKAENLQLRQQIADLQCELSKVPEAIGELIEERR